MPCNKTLVVSSLADHQAPCPVLLLCFLARYLCVRDNSPEAVTSRIRADARGKISLYLIIKYSARPGGEPHSMSHGAFVPDASNPAC